MTGPESMVTLQERMVNLIGQLNMPVLETSLVISRWTNRLLKQLSEHSSNIRIILPILGRLMLSLLKVIHHLIWKRRFP